LDLSRGLSVFGEGPRFDEEEYMPRPEKVRAVENIREQVDEARATFITEYRGLTVAEQQQLRRDIRRAEGEYRVLKMSLARRAVEDMEVEGLTDLLAGPTALAFASTDPVPVAKALKDFASEHESLIIKGGLLAGALLPPEQISRLAEIESRDVLLGRIAGGFKSPMSKLAGMLGAKLRDAASMFSQLLEKKETEEPAPAADAVAQPEAEAEQATDAEEAPEVETEEAPKAGSEETPEAEVDEAPDAAAEETPTADAEDTPEAEAEDAPAAGIEEGTETDAEETPEVETEETPKIGSEETPAAEVEEAPDAAAEETPEADAEETPEVETEEVTEAEAEEADPEPTPKKKAAPKAKAEESPKAAADETPAGKPGPKPKKKAAPKAKAEESAAPADADEEAASDTDETAEEE
jgi:large subunit ribosomal protein L10